jgi:hypothetical protein
MKRWIIRTLVRLYPVAWRREYGVELTDTLLARPLTVGIIGDVLRNGLWQRLRSAEPAMLVGLGMMLMALLQHPLNTSLYLLVLFACGLWTSLRHGGDSSKSGRTAIKISILAGIPVMISGAMLWAGVLGAAIPVAKQFCWLRVSDPTSFWEGLRSATCAPAPLGFVISPLVMLPQAWLWGTLGGSFGRWISSLR